MIKAGIIGATGYAGGELVRLLLDIRMWKLNGMAPEAIWIRNTQCISEYVPAGGRHVCRDDNLEALADQVDVIFTATPQGSLCVFGQ